MTSLAALAVLATASWVAPMTARAEDRARIDPTVILGNRELPKVLYIVPWKKPVAGELAGRPLVSVVDEALAPIDRDVFQRQVQYRSQSLAQQPMRPPPAAASAPLAAGATVTAPTPPPLAASAP